MKKGYYCQILWLILLLFFQGHRECFALEKETHRAINEYVATTSNSFSLNSYLVNQLGYKNGVQEVLNGKEIWKWIRDGGKTEDEPAYTRSRNHFHDPLKPWDQAGLNSFLFSGMSSALWIQDQTNRRLTDLGGDWSWKKARQFCYAALTGNSKALDGFKVEEGWLNSTTIFGRTNMSDVERKQFLAWAFRAVGQTMHLVEDASVPEHTRNDVHIRYNYENYVDDLRSSNSANFKTLLSNPILFSSPVNSGASFIDADQYDGTNLSITFGSNIGLAEYSNANFFSEDTIFTDYPHPAYAETTYPNIDWTKPEIIDAEDGKLDGIIYIRKTIGEAADIRLASLSYISYDCIKKGKYDFSPLVLDDNVYSDYAALLIPRAVGYSAGLLDYFFRGRIEISLPQSALYASTGDKNAGFTRISLLAVNDTSDGDEMPDGTIELVARYRTVAQDPFQALDLQASNDYFYAVVPEATGKRTIPRGTPVELAFYLDRTTIIPVNAVDVSLQVVYHGKLGNEDGAVAVGWKSISDPTPVELVNNMDKICLYGSWYDAGSQAAIDQVDSNHNGVPEWDIYPHDLANIYIKISPDGNPVQASSSDCTFTSAILNAGKLLRAYILGDSETQLNHSHYATVVKTTSSDTFTHASDIFDGIWSGYVIKSDVETSGETTVCSGYGFSTPCAIRHAPLFYSFKGNYLWGPMATIFDNPKYPIDTNCNWQALQ
jgi:hypothetical protein